MIIPIGDTYFSYMEILAKTLEGPTVFVIDNASYHTIMTEDTRCPTSATIKGSIISWLEKKKNSFERDMLKVINILMCIL